MVSRPISQHGLARMIQTPSGINNRNVLDKRYYISAIQNHMFSLSEEIAKLKKQLTENKFEATNYEECKKQVEELSQQMAEREETLMVYNTAIETVMFKGNKNDIDAEAENIRKSKHEKIQQLELMYSDKLKLEESLAKVEKELETEKQLFNNKIAEMPENMQTQYFTLKQERDQLKREEEILSEKVKSLKKNINIYEQQIFRNERKHMLYNLSTKLNDLQRRYYKLEDENKIKRSPSQEREYLLEQVKQDRSDVEILKLKCDEQRTELEKYRERLSELEDELSEKNSARLNKYKELLKRQETMTTFLEAFPKLFSDELQKIKDHTAIIVNSLEYMSRNVQDNNSSQEIDKDPNYIFSLNSKDDIEKEYKKIKTQHNMIQSIYKRHQSELEELTAKTNKYNEELSVYEDIELAKQNLQQQEIELDSRVKTLSSTLKSTLLAVTEAQNRKAELESQLENNEGYKSVKVLEKKLKQLDEENKKMEELINDSPGLRDFQKFKNKSMAEVKEIFAILKSKYEGKK